MRDATNGFASASDPAGSGPPARADLRAPAEIRVATEDWEFRQIHRLNHATFVEEIPQHPAHASGLLIDRFHQDNVYLIAVKDRQIVGMVAVRGQRPFSLDLKMGDVDAFVPVAGRCCELRLLAVEKGARSGPLLRAILSSLWKHCLAWGYEAAVISATTRQLKLYRHLGFEPFGALVGTPGALFQPMVITRQRAEAVLERLCSPRALSKME